MSLEICNMPAFADVSDGRVQSLKVLEEASELCEAGKICSKVAEDYKKVARTSMLDELADVVQTIVNFMECFDITEEELSRAVRRCIERNKERGRY